MKNIGLSSADNQLQHAAIGMLKEALHTHHKARLRVNGTSMLPVFRPGDVLIIKSACLEDCAIGDILTVARSADIVTHRLIKINSSEITLKADNTLQSDAPVQISELLGIVVGVERSGRYRNIRKNAWGIFNRLMGWLGAQEAHFAHKARQNGNQAEDPQGNIFLLLARFRRNLLNTLVGLLWRLGK